MPKIAIIDDNTDQSTTVKLNIEIELRKIQSDLEVIAELPLENPEDYFNFIDEKEICVLILDEKLNDQAIEGRGPVNYTGSNLVSHLRTKLKEFPIFSLTVIPQDSTLKAKYSEYEEIIGRKEFYNNAEKYVPKFWRAAKNYLKENLDELSQYNVVTQLIAGGNNDPEVLKKLSALQVKLDMPFSTFKERNEWLTHYEKLIGQLEELKEEIKVKLDKNDELETN